MLLSVGNCGKSCGCDHFGGDYLDICASQPAVDYRRCLHPGSCHMDRVDHTGPVYLLSKLQIEYGIHIFPPEGHYLAGMTKVTLQLLLVPDDVGICFR